MIKLPSWLAGLVQALLTLSIPVVLIISPLYLFVTPGFVRHEYGRKGFPPAQRFHDAERLRLSDTILAYLRGRASLEEMATMRTDQGEIALTEEEVQHLVDVKGVMDGFFLAHGLALGLALLSLLLLGLSPQRQRITLCLRWGSWITAGLIALVVITSVVDFDLFFTRFHELFFRAGSWIFYPEDTLIQLYPLPFWQDAVWKIGAVILLEWAALYSLSRIRV